MNTQQIIKYWRFPKETIINRQLPKTDIYTQLKKTKDKKMIRENVKRIWWLSSFRTENTNVSRYETDDELFTEIEFLYAKIKEQNQAKEVFKVLASIIPYPLVVLVDLSEGFVVYTGKYRRLKGDYLKLLNVYPSAKINENQLEEELKKLSLYELPTANFKVLYEELMSVVAATKIKEEYGVFSISVDTNIQDKINQLSTEINQLTSKAKKEKQLNRRIPLLIELKEKEEEKNRLLESL